MKRVWIVLTVLCMLLSLAACAKKPTDSPITDPTSADSISTTTAPAVGEDTTTTSGNATATTRGNTTATTKAPPSSNVPTTTTTQVIVSGDAVFSETTVADNANCLIKITKIDEKGEGGYTLYAHLENRMSDTDLLFSVDNAAINGILTDPLFATEIAAGESADEMIVFYDVVPEGLDIGTYTDIMLQFSVNDVDNWEAAPVAEVTAHIYPLGADKTTTYTHKKQATDRVLLDNAYVTLIALGSAENTQLGYYYTDVYFVNKTDQPLIFSVEESTINGLAVEPYYGIRVDGGYSTYDAVVWLNDPLAASNIETVEEIAFTFYAYTEQEFDPDSMEEEDWEASYLVKEPLVYKP